MCPAESTAAVRPLSPACRCAPPVRPCPARRGGGEDGVGGAGGGSVRAVRPASVSLAASCTVDGVRIEVEEGVLGGFTGESPCSYTGRFVGVWRAVYEE